MPGEDGAAAAVDDEVVALGRGGDGLFDGGVQRAVVVRTGAQGRALQQIFTATKSL